MPKLTNLILTLIELAKMTPYMWLERKKIILNSFFNAQFNYCPCNWLLHSRINNNEIKQLHQRCLQLIYSDKTSSCETILEKDGSVSILQKHFQTLATEMFEVKHDLRPEITSNIFIEVTNCCYNLLCGQCFRTPLVKSVYHQTETIA